MVMRHHMTNELGMVPIAIEGEACAGGSLRTPSASFSFSICYVFLTPLASRVLRQRPSLTRLATLVELIA